MDESIFGAIATSLAHSGPEWLLAFGALLIAAWLASKGMPFFTQYKMALLDIERSREERKAEESKQREQHDRELATMQGQWLEQYDRANKAQEQSNVVTEGVRAQMAMLNQTLEDSKERSHEMGATLSNAARQIEDIHDHIVKGSK